MATFTASPARLDWFLRPQQSPDVRGPLTLELTITGSEVPGGAITLAKVGSAAWLTIPAECVNGVAFDVTVSPTDQDKSHYRPMDVSAIIRASYGAFDDLDIAVAMKVPPGANLRTGT